ncbi:MAG TPA: hypothetical protein VF756_21320 [Thermoanaerobaculia bacterium]
MKRKYLSFCVALCLSILAAANAAVADPGQQMSDRIEQMKLDGWQEVAEGVLQRTLGSRVETFAYGEAGMRWSAEKLKERAGLLQEEYNRHPSEDLAQVIENLQMQVAEKENSLEISQATAADSFGGGETLDACTIIYDATADAYGLTGSSAPGTGATAYARWYSDCGHVGNTYAYAYSRATKNGTQTIQIVEDPQAGLTRSGTNITSSATSSAPGSTDCFSEAYSRSWNPSLNIDYSSHDSNYICPNPPSVTINGVTSTSISGTTCQTITWTSTVTNGVPSYSYAWYRDGSYVGSGSSHSATFCGSNTNWTQYVNLSLYVTDSIGQQGSDTHSTTVYYTATSSGGGGGGMCPPYCTYEN